MKRPADPAPSAPSHQALERAAAWFALLLSGQASAKDQRDWQAWLHASGEHQQAWAYVERLRARLSPIHASPAPHLAVSAWQKSQARRRTLLGLTTLAGAGALAYLARRHTPFADMTPVWAADHRTGIGEVRSILLADGSRIWLNAASAVHPRDHADARHLHLLRGEVLIATARDPRPFWVETAQGRLHALGTRFAVRLLDDDHTLLAVYEGAVAVHTHAGDGTVVRAAEQCRFNRHAVSAIEAADPARESWRRGVLIARNIPLADVVEQLRPYHHGHLGLAPAVAPLRVFGSYPLNDPERALRMLERVMPIRVRRTLPWWIRIVPAA